MSPCCGWPPFPTCIVWTSQGRPPPQLYKVMPHKHAQRPISKVILDSVRLLTNTITTSNQGQNVLIYDQFCLIFASFCLIPWTQSWRQRCMEVLRRVAFQRMRQQCSIEVASHWDMLLVATENALWAAPQDALRLGFWLRMHAHACCAGSLAF